MLQPLDITFFGRHCRFSAITLAALIEAGHRVNLVILPHYRESGVHILQRPALGPRLTLSPTGGDPAILPSVAGLAWGAGAMLVEVSRDQLESLPRRFDRLRKGVVVSACYPWKLPQATVDSPPLRALNLHPSLLPAHRGPDPIFWTLHAGDTTTGATVHWMTSELDAGPHVAQNALDIPLRTRYDQLEERAVRLGTRLLLEALDQLPDLPPTNAPANTPLEPYPTPTDLHIHTDWTSERAFRFAYGASPGYGPLTVRLPGGQAIDVIDATDFRPGASIDGGHAIRGDRVSVEFADGVVQFVSGP